MSESSLPVRRRRLAELWPITALCLGIVLSLGWVAVLAWLFVLILHGLL
jgi:hypothetical protein